MATPGVYGVPGQAAFGIPTNKSPLRAYMRQSAAYASGSQNVADPNIFVTLPMTPLPGSILLGAINMSHDTTTPDLWSVSQTGYRWYCVAKMGNLDANVYPMIELWVGVPTPGVVGGTVVTVTGHRGGWVGWGVAEVPGIIGRAIDSLTQGWNGTAPITVAMDHPAPQDCLAVAHGAITSGGAGLVPTSSGWPYVAIQDGFLGVRPLPKGQTTSITASAGRNRSQLIMITLMV